MMECVLLPILRVTPSGLTDFSTIKATNHPHCPVTLIITNGRMCDISDQPCMGALAKVDFCREFSFLRKDPCVALKCNNREGPLTP